MPQTFRDEGIYTITARQIDVAGNVSAHTKPIQITIDKTALPPKFSGVINGGYYKNAEVSIIGDFVAIIEYSTDNGQHLYIYTDTLSFSSENTYTIITKQKDLAGNVSLTSQVQFTIDKTSLNPPIIAGIASGSYNADQSFIINGEIGATIYYTLDGGTTWNEYSSQVVLSVEGGYTIAAKQTSGFGGQRICNDFAIHRGDD